MDIIVLLLNVLVLLLLFMEFFNISKEHFHCLFVDLFLVNKNSIWIRINAVFKSRIILDQSQSASRLTCYIVEVLEDRNCIFLTFTCITMRCLIPVFPNIVESIHNISVVDKPLKDIIFEDVCKCESFHLLLMCSHIYEFSQKLRAFTGCEHALLRHCNCKLLGIAAVFVHIVKTAKVFQKLKIHFFLPRSFIHY